MFENKNFFGFTLLLIGLELAGCTLNTACLKDFAAPGRGREALKKWSYNPDTEQCESFIFRGQNPSKNQFDDEKTCMSVCDLDACPEGYALTDVDIPDVGPGEEKSDIISVGCTRTNSSQVDVKVNGEGRSGHSCNRNDWDSPQWCHCKPGQRISTFESWHDNHREDRQWDLKCANIQPNKEAMYTNWEENYSGLNWWDSVFHWNGRATNAYMVGMSSNHDNHREDRRYQVIYRRSNNWVLTCCSNWISLNSMDGYVKHVLGDQQVIAELYSHHNNHNEDRMFHIKVCHLGLK